VTSAHMVTLVAVPGEASDADAPEQLSDDDRVPLIVIRNRFGCKPSVTQTGRTTKCTGLPQTARHAVPAKGPPLFSNRDGCRSDVPIAGPTDIIFDVGPLLLALPMMVAVKQTVTIVFHTPGRFLEEVGG
jgi:hypothetical protein